MIISRYLINLEMIYVENERLLNIMEKCGHFLYHRKGGKKGQRKIMDILVKEGEISQKRLLELVNIRSGSLSEFLIKLESKGLITREKSAEDKRQFKIKPTPQGEAFYNLKKREEYEQNRILFDALTVDEQEQLETLLSRLLAYWENTFEVNYTPYHQKEDKYV